MYDELGEVKTIIDRDALGRKTITYTWDGPPVAILQKRLFRSADTSAGVLEVGPYLVQIIDNDFVSDCFTVARIDDAWSWWYALKFQARALWRDFTWRMVETLIIWGLAKRPERGVEVGWYLVKERWF